MGKDRRIWWVAKFVIVNHPLNFVSKERFSSIILWRIVQMNWWEEKYLIYILWNYVLVWFFLWGFPLSLQSFFFIGSVIIVFMLKTLSWFLSGFGFRHKWWFFDSSFIKNSNGCELFCVKPREAFDYYKSCFHHCLCRFIHTIFIMSSAKS